MKKGLILEGGAMRGMFTAGVLDVMMENGIEFDGAIGVSAGACFGCNYKSKQPGRAIRYNTRFCDDKRYSGIGCLIRTGDIFSKDFAYGEVPVKYDPFDFETYKKNPMDFYVVCIDVETGEPVYHKYEGWEDHGFDWIRASASMPTVSRIVEIDGQKLLDGGVYTSIPVKQFEDMGYDRNVAILTQPEGFVKKKNPLLPVMRIEYCKYPKFVEAIATRQIRYNEETAYVKKREDEGELFVIRPAEKLDIKKVEKDPAKLKEVYEIGRAAVTPRIQEMKEYLAR